MANNKFVSLMGNTTFTENEMPTNKSTLNPNLDLFYRIGVKSVDPKELVRLFTLAVTENPALAVKTVGWSRSVRDGAGVRNNMRTILDVTRKEYVDWTWFKKEGYWKDLFFYDPRTLTDTVVEDMLKVIKQGLDEEDNLLLKYLPRRKKNKAHKNNAWIRVITKHLEINEAEYRKIITKYRSPEALICLKRFWEIDYSQMPSKAFQKHLKTLKKHDPVRVDEFLKKAAKGEVKVTAGAVYPHEILKLLKTSQNDSYFYGWDSFQDNDLAEAQWKNLPNKFKSNKKIMVVGDTSGSMVGDDSIWISLALTIYCSERLTGAFHNFACTFSESPSFIQFRDDMTLAQKVRQIPQIVGNTDIERVFDLILERAAQYNVPAEDMPEMILIISDMQFDMGTEHPQLGVQGMIDAKYKKHPDYPKPAVVYWNVRNSHGMPITANDKGVIVFSGASPNTIQQAIEGEVDPMAAFLRVVDHDRYNYLVEDIALEEPS